MRLGSNVSNRSSMSIILWVADSQRIKLSAVIEQLFSPNASKSTNRNFVSTRWSIVALRLWNSSFIGRKITGFMHRKDWSNELASPISRSHLSCFLWEYVKDTVYSARVINVTPLKRPITSAVCIVRPDVLKYVLETHDERLKELVRPYGGHNERLYT